MKNHIFLLLCILLLCILLFPVNNYASIIYCSDTGSDDSTGLSWETAKLTIDSTLANIAGSDTAVFSGIFMSQNMTLDSLISGIPGQETLIIDSLSFTDGYDSALPDTFYGAYINSVNLASSLVVNDADYIHIVGMYFDSGISNIAIFGPSDYIKIQQCKFRQLQRNNDMLLSIGEVKNMYLISCFIITENQAVFSCIKSIANAVDGLDTLYVYNNTAYGDFDIFINIREEEKVIDARNNIAHCTDASDFIYARIDTSTLGTIDYNVYYSDLDTFKASMYNGAIEEIATSANITEWQTILQPYDIGPDTLTLNVDPELIDDEKIIETTSPAAYTGKNIGYGCSRGYYQFICSGSGMVIMF